MRGGWRRPASACCGWASTPRRCTRNFSARPTNGARDAARKINEAFAADGQRPIVFSTLVKPDLSAVIRTASGMHMDLIQTFVARGA